jgi:hypothetical protein
MSCIATCKGELHIIMSFAECFQHINIMGTNCRGNEISMEKKRVPYSGGAEDLGDSRGLDAKSLNNNASECKHSNTSVLDLSLAQVKHVGP